MKHCVQSVSLSKYQQKQTESIPLSDSFFTSAGGNTVPVRPVYQYLSSNPQPQKRYSISSFGAYAIKYCPHSGQLYQVLQYHWKGSSSSSSALTPPETLSRTAAGSLLADSLSILSQVFSIAFLSSGPRRARSPASRTRPPGTFSMFSSFSCFLSYMILLHFFSYSLLCQANMPTDGVICHLLLSFFVVSGIHTESISKRNTFHQNKRENDRLFISLYNCRNIPGCRQMEFPCHRIRWSSRKVNRSDQSGGAELFLPNPFYRRAERLFQ